MPGSITRYAGERGQTLPFWVFSILMAFALVFFVVNYTYTIQYQIKAQNAADSAAVAALAEDANAANTVQTLLYALSVQETVMRGYNAAVTKLLADTTNCPNGAASLAGGSGTCFTNFTTLASNYASAEQTYQSVLAQLGAAKTKLDDIASGSFAQPTTTVDTFFKNNCVPLNTDCSFKYSTNIDAQPTMTAPMTVTETACRVVPSLAAKFLGLSKSTFYALGRTKVTLASYPAQISPQSANTNGLGTQTRYRDLLPSSATPNAYLLDLAGVQATTGMLEPTSAGSSTDPVDFTSQCGS